MGRGIAIFENKREFLVYKYFYNVSAKYQPLLPERPMAAASLPGIFQDGCTNH